MTVDIIIPVYNEGENIVATLDGLREYVRTPCRVLICYDFDEDTTLAVLEKHDWTPLEIQVVKNQSRGAHGAVMTGFSASDAEAVIVMPADDDYNGPIIDAMVEKCSQGDDIVAASRFIPGGCMEGCPWLKAVLVRTAAFVLFHVAAVPTRDATSGFRLFSRRVVREIPVESTEGFVYSIELLVKAHRLGWSVGEVPARWYERRHGQSRFRVIKWLPAYLRWFFYAMETRFLKRGPESVPLHGHL